MSGFNVRTIGPETSGATTIQHEDLEGLIPDFVATRADLNQVEFENITKVLAWARAQAVSLGPDGVLDYGFMMDLHRRMFGDVWRWAGTQRRRVTNIGVDPSLITTQTQLLLQDARYWHEHETFPRDEAAARIHCRLVSIHPFPNGNGRCTRLMAVLYLLSTMADPFPWGAMTLEVDGKIGRCTSKVSRRRAVIITKICAAHTRSAVVERRSVPLRARRRFDEFAACSWRARAPSSTLRRAHTCSATWHKRSGSCAAHWAPWPWMIQRYGGLRLHGHDRFHPAGQGLPGTEPHLWGGVVCSGR